NLDHPAARKPADSKRNVEPEAAGRDRVDLDLLAASELHRRALAERAVDLRERGFQCFLAIHARRFHVPYDFELRIHDHPLPILARERITLARIAAEPA